MRAGVQEANRRSANRHETHLMPTSSDGRLRSRECVLSWLRGVRIPKSQVDQAIHFSPSVGAKCHRVLEALVLEKPAFADILLGTQVPLEVRDSRRNDETCVECLPMWRRTSQHGRGALNGWMVCEARGCGRF